MAFEPNGGYRTGRIGRSARYAVAVRTALELMGDPEREVATPLAVRSASAGKSRGRPMEVSAELLGQSDDDALRAT